MIYHNCWIKVWRLRKLFDPFKRHIWPNCDRPIRWSEVRSAINSGRLRDSQVRHPIGCPCGCSPESVVREHAERVAWLSVNGWRDPLAIHLSGGQNGRPMSPPVEDGIHRLAAAIITRRDWILVCITGDVQRAHKILKPYIYSDGTTC